MNSYSTLKFVMAAGLLISFPALAAVPGAPTNVVAVAGNTQATVSFSPPASDGGSPITGYTVTSSPGGITKTGTASPITVTGLTNGTAYTFIVTATNVIGTGPASAASNSVTPVATIDLIISALSTTTTSVPANGSFSLSSTETNQGTAAMTVSSNAVRFYLSTDTTITTTDILIGSRTVSGALAAGAGSTASTTVTVPATVTAGTYYLGAIADATLLQAESVETNNTRTATATIAVTATPAVDLIMSALSTTTTSVPANGSFSLSSTETNQGTAAMTVSSNAVRFYLSTDATITTTDIQIGARNVGTLAAKAASTVSTTVTVPGTVVPGTYYLGAIADATLLQAETVETNNTRTATATIAVTATPAVDLIMSALSTTTTSVPANGSFSLSSTETNQGTAAMTATSNVVRFYLSADTTITSADTLIGSRTVSGALAAGAGSTASTTVTVPATVTAGTYYLGAIADATLLQAESVETNNTRTAAATLSVTTAPGAPTGVVAVAGNTQATVSFSPPASDGGSPITGYTVTSSPGGITKTGTASPITVTGLTNGTAYTFTVTASNAVGTGPASAPSNSVTPVNVPPTVTLTAPQAGAVIDWKADNVIATIATSGYPISVENGHLYALNDSANNVAVIDGVTNAVTATIAVGLQPRAIASNPNTNRIYVANWGSNNVSVINGTTNAVIATVALGGVPLAIAVNPGTNKIYVAHGNSNSVAVIDGATNVVTATIAIGGTPNEIAVNTVTNKIYVTNRSGNNVKVIDGATNAITATVAAGIYPISIAINTSTNKIYVVNQDSDNVTVINGATNAPTTVAVGANPKFIAINQATNNIYVTDALSVTVINGATNGTTSITVGFFGPSGIAVNSLTNKIYVSNYGGGYNRTLTVINGPDNSTTEVPTGLGPAYVAINPNTNKTYVANITDFTITVITDDSITLAASATDDISVSKVDFYRGATLLGSDTTAPYSYKWANMAAGNYTLTAKATDNQNAVTTSSSVPVTIRTVPGAPTNVVATGGNQKATITFTPPVSNGGAPITSYTVRGGFNNFATCTGSPCVITGLINGATYVFKVSATNIIGTGSTSILSNSVVPTATAPDAPANVVAVAGNTQATVSFSPPGSNGGSPITGYTVTASPGGITVTGTASPITVTGLTNGTAYTFTVKATNAVGTGPASAASNSVTPVATIDLIMSALSTTTTSVPANGSFSLSSTETNQGTIAMTASSNVVQFYLSTDATITTADTLIGSRTVSGALAAGAVSTASTTVTVPATVTAGTYYLGAIADATLLQAESVETNNTRAATATLSVTTAPGAPTNVVAVAGNAQATVSFTPPASNGGSTITGYTVTSSPGGITATGTTSPITVTGLTNGTAYTFTVKATNVIGTGSASAPSNSVTPSTVPGAPTNVVAVAGNTQATVSFTPPASDGGSPITGYTVTSSPGGITATGTASPITVTGLTNGTTYTFTVTATNGAGTGSPSIASNSVTLSMVPGAPTNVVATAGDSYAIVTFAAPASNGGSAITGYTVTSSPAGGVDSNAGSTGLTHTITGLVNGTAYTFTVTASNAVGTGPASAASNSVTPAYMAQAYYIHTDHLDTPRQITDASGNVVWQWDNSDPFGNNMANENPNGAGQFTFNLRFPGQYFDRGTNTHYNYFRDYDPSIGRYIQFDPIGVVLYRNMAARNLAAIVGPVSPELAAQLYSSVPIYNHPYGYGANDPISQIDPLGLANSGPWPKPKPTPPRKPSELPYDSTYTSCAQYPGGTCEGKSLNSLCKTFGTDPNSNCTRKCLQVSLPPGGGDDPPISWYIPQHPVCWYECGWPGGWR